MSAALSGRWRKSPPAPAAERLRAGRRCSRSASCPCATFETAPCDGSGCPACGRKRLRPPARPQRLPRQVLALAPAALAARHAMLGIAASDACSAQCFPRVIGERVLAIGREEFCELPPLLVREARADADVLQRAGVVEKAEQQRADMRALAFLVPAKAGNDAVAIALVLDLEHHALVRLVGSR